MKRFLDWLASGGAEFSRLRVTTTARGGRGVVATAAFAPGDVLLRVPEPLLLTVDRAERRPDVADALRRRLEAAHALDARVREENARLAKSRKYVTHEVNETRKTAAAQTRMESHS